MHASRLVPVLLLGSVAHAQLQMYPFTETDVGVFATDGKTPDLTTKPKGKYFPKQARAEAAKAPGVLTGIHFHRVLTARGVRMRHYCFVDAAPTNANAAGGTTQSTSKTNIKQGSASYLLNVRFPRRAALVISAVGTKSGNGSLKFDVDLDANGRVNYTYTMDGKGLRRVWATFKGGNGKGTARKIRVTVTGSASWVRGGSHYDGTLQLWLQRPRKKECFHNAYGKPCDDVKLLVRDAPTSANRHVFTISVSDAPKNAPAILAVGLVPTTFTVPGIRCPILLVPSVYAPLTTSATGTATLSFNYNQRVQVPSYNQVAVADPQNNKTLITNGVRMTCFDQ